MKTTWTKRTWSMTAGIAAGVLVAAAAGATGAAANDSKPKRADATFVIFEPFDEGSTTEVDVGTAGFGAGDNILEHHPVVDAETGDHLGTVVRDLRVVETYPDGDFLFVVYATFKFGDGDIHEAGAARFSDVAEGRAVVAVTGGTGAYSRSAGTVTGRLGTREGHDGVFLTFDVTRPR